MLLPGKAADEFSGGSDEPIGNRVSLADKKWKREEVDGAGQ